jgi:hypothetical protein
MAFTIVQAFSKVTSTSAVLIDVAESVYNARTYRTPAPLQVIVSVKTSDIVLKFGDADVVADDTLTSDSYIEGNYPCVAGTVQTIDLPRGTTHVSVKAEGDGAVKLAVGFGEE